MDEPEATSPPSIDNGGGSVDRRRSSTVMTISDDPKSKMVVMPEGIEPSTL